MADIIGLDGKKLHSTPTLEEPDGLALDPKIGEKLQNAEILPKPAGKTPLEIINKEIDEHEQIILEMTERKKKLHAVITEYTNKLFELRIVKTKLLNQGKLNKKYKETP